jgi:PadR family transcriptional regulator PadR
MTLDTRLISGALETLSLEVLSVGPSYGYEITQTVLERSGGRFDLKEGSLYPALHRLERDALLASYWEEHKGRRLEYYKLSADGKKALQERRQQW